MDFIIINVFKKYFDVFKIAEKMEFPDNQLEEIHPTTLAVLKAYCKDEGFSNKVKELCSELNYKNWNYLKECYFSLKLFHIVYYDDVDNIYSEGVDVYALDMADACDKFISQCGKEPYICTFKR